VIVNVANDLEETVRAKPLDATEVANRLRPTLMRLARELRREVHPLGVTGGQVALLFQIRRGKNVSAGDLAASEGISPAAMSGYVERLAKAGLVVRVQDERDRRRQVLQVTEEAESVLRKVRSRRTAWLASRLQELSADELAAVDAAIEPLLALLERGDA
jgi:DNA-binding MarR family transcriptional regulator